MAQRLGFRNRPGFTGAGDMVFDGHYQWLHLPPPYKGN
jgi:hypothetical protein